jgi:peptidylprolyl isomerase
VSAPTGATGATGATGPSAPSASTAVPPVPADISHKPKVVVPKGPAPKTLVVKDLIVGTGPPAKAGDNLTVQYVGVLFKNGKQFDASWDRHMPFPLTLGQGQVIPGWDKGLVGMRLHGRRELIIPANLAYGATARPGIPANSPLVFVIDLVKLG